MPRGQRWNARSAGQRGVKAWEQPPGHQRHPACAESLVADGAIAQRCMALTPPSQSVNRWRKPGIWQDMFGQLVQFDKPEAQ